MDPNLLEVIRAIAEIKTRLDIVIGQHSSAISDLQNRVNNLEKDRASAMGGWKVATVVGAIVSTAVAIGWKAFEAMSK